MQYRYAIDEHHNVVDVIALASRAHAKGQNLVCAGCGGPVVPVLGRTRERHFRHKRTDGRQECSRETYLHKLAKTLIADSFRAAVTAGRPYWLKLKVAQVCRHWEKQFGFACEGAPGLRSLDLTRYFDTVAVEVGVEGFVADVLLSSSSTGERLLVEVVVSHECTPEKIATGLRILEIGVDGEADLQSLSAGLDTGHHWHKLHNFKDQAPNELACKGQCDRELAAFCVFESGKSFIKVGRPQEIAAVMRAQKTIHSHIVREAEFGIITPHLAAGDGYHIEALKALRAGAPVKCCTFCRYAGFRTYEKPVYCKIKRLEVSVNEAATCNAYKLNDTI